MLNNEELSGLKEILGKFNKKDNDNKSERKQMLDFARRIISEELTDKQRNVLYGLYVQQKTPAELANEMNITAGAVSRIKARGILNIRRWAKYTSFRP